MKKGKHMYWGEEIKAELAHLEDISQKRHLFTTRICRSALAFDKWT